MHKGTDGWEKLVPDKVWANMTDPTKVASTNKYQFKGKEFTDFVRMI